MEDEVCRAASFRRELSASIGLGQEATGGDGGLIVVIGILSSRGRFEIFSLRFLNGGIEKGDCL